MIHKAISLLLGWYKIIGSLVVAVCIACVFLCVTRLDVDNTIKIWFLEDDPTYAEYLKFQEKYGSDDVLTVMTIHKTSVFDTTVLDQLESTEQMLKELSFVDEVLSLVSAVYFKTSGKSFREERIINAPDTDVDKIKRRFRKAPLMLDRFVNLTERKSFLYIRLKPLESIEEDRDLIVRKIRAVLDRQEFDYKLSGMAVLNEALNAKVIEESGFFSTLSMAVIFCILLLYFKKIKIALLAMTAVVVPIIIFYGIFVLTGHELNMISMIIPTILMVYCVADSTHIINRYQYVLNSFPQKDKVEKITEAFLYSWKPCFYTSLTTAAGYIGFSFSPLIALKDTGLFAALGIGISFFMTFFVLGCGFMHLKENSIKKGTRSRYYSWIKLDRLIDRTALFSEKQKYTLIAVGLITLILALIFSPKIDIDNHAIEYLDKNNTARLDSEAIEAESGAYLPYEIIIRSTIDSSLLKREYLRSIQDFQAALVKDSLMIRPFSMATLVRRIKRAYSGNPWATLTLNDHRKLKIAFQDYGDRGGKGIKDLSKDSFTEIRINASVKMKSSSGFKQLMNEIEKTFAREVPEHLGLEMKSQGYVPLFVKMIHYLTTSQLRSFCFAFLFVVIFLLVCFRSMRIVIVSVLPNLLPIAVVLLLMVAFSIPLDTGTVMIAAVILGISVDDTIHFLHAYLNKPDTSHLERIINSISVTGRAMVLSTAALVCGFGIIGLSSLRSLQYFGLLCALAVFIALLADLILLPAVLSISRRKNAVENP